MLKGIEERQEWALFESQPVMYLSVAASLNKSSIPGNCLVGLDHTI
jgi:hypothetical protein